MKEVALAFLVNQGKLLLYQRDNRRDIDYPGYWAPLGGQVEEGESPLEAVRREILEEIGCEASDLTFLRRLDVVNNPMCADHTIYLFGGKIDKKLKEMRLTEGQALRYFTADELISLNIPDLLKPYFPF